MANKHINGDDPYRMTASDARKEIDNWVDRGGQVRIDGPHQGNPEPHVHMYIDNKPSEDILIQLEPDPEPEPESESETESDDNDSPSDDSSDDNDNTDNNSSDDDD